MIFEEIFSAINEEKRVGACYQKSGHGQFRDRVTVYRDGKALFERFCYGEAAGLVFTMWGKATSADIAWDYDACPNSRKTEAPCALTGGDVSAVQFDGKQVLWECVDMPKSDRAHGYSAVGGLFGRLLGK